MSKIKTKRKTGKLLAFEQTGDFFYRRGLDRLDQNKLLDAMVYYRRALKEDAQNPEICLAIAEALTEMHRFDESNRFLFMSFRNAQTLPSEYYYGIGMNFLGLKEYTRARESLAQYVYVDPDGEFLYDAYEILDALEETAEEDALEARILRELERAHELLSRGDADAAARILEKLVRAEPQDIGVRNKLALAYYCKRDFEAAQAVLDEILRVDPGNIQARCNQALFLHDAGDKEGAQRACALIAGAQTEDPEDLGNMALSLMELGHIEEAYAIQKRLFRIFPYDQDVTHRLAQCAYCLGEEAYAAQCYARLLKINANDSIAHYYRNVCRRAMAGAGPRKRNIAIAYQVPEDEALRRLHRIREYLHGDAKARRAQWQKDGGEMETLIRWGLQYELQSIKGTLLRLVAGFHDRKAEAILRDFLLQRAQPAHLKQEVLGLLKRMDAAEPYLSYMDGELVESKVSLIRVLDKSIPDAYNRVLERALREIEGHSERSTMQAANQWNNYIASLDESFPGLSEAQGEALAAALAYTGCRLAGEKVTKSEFCRRFGVTLVRFNKALAKIMHAETEERPE